MDGLQQATQTVMNALSGNTENVKKEQEYNTSIPIKDKQSISRFENPSSMINHGFMNVQP